MPRRQHPYTVHFNVQSIRYLFYIQVWEIGKFQFYREALLHCDLLGISFVAYVTVFAVYDYYICIVHLTF